MDTNIDQAKLEGQVRQLLFTAKKEERIAAEQPDTAQHRLNRADELRRQAQDKGRDLPPDVMERLFKEYSSGNVVR
jgi:hypothetical protein